MKNNIENLIENYIFRIGFIAYNNNLIRKEFKKFVNENKYTISSFSLHIGNEYALFTDGTLVTTIIDKK